jgi:hypothetical protein
LYGGEGRLEYLLVVSARDNLSLRVLLLLLFERLKRELLLAKAFASLHLGEEERHLFAYSIF